MNAMTRKDVRAVWPFFAATFVTPLVFLPLLYYFQEDAVLGWSLFVCGVLSVAMGVMIFGDEFSNRTMGLLLVQPLSRSKIWRRKMLVLGSALGVCSVTVALRVFLRLGFFFSMPTLLAFGLVLVFTLGVFCTTPFWTLSLKNTLGAIAATILTPLVLIFLTDTLMEYFFRQWSWSAPSNMPWVLQPVSLVIACILALYFALCYWLGRGMFLHLEVTDSPGREIALPDSLQPLFAPLWRVLTPGHGSPLRSLITKELYLQRVCFGMAAVSSVVFFFGAASWRLSKSEWARTSATVTMAGSFAICFLLVPLIAGGVCVAEERNWGMLGWHLILPPSRKKQWLVKVCVALASSLILGILVPIGVFYFCKLLIHLPFDPLTNLPFDPLTSDGILLLIPYLLLTGIAIYASSLITNTLRAVILTLALASAGGGAISLAVMAGLQLSRMLKVFRMEVIHHTPVFFSSILNPVFLFIFLPATVLAVLLYLAYINFRAGEISPRRKWLQPFALWAGFLAILLIISLVESAVFFD